MKKIFNMIIGIDYVEFSTRRAQSRLEYYSDPALCLVLIKISG